MPEDSTKNRRRLRFTLRALLLLLVPLCAGLAIWGQIGRQRTRAATAFQKICDKGVDANFDEAGDSVIFFKHANVRDADLAAFIPAFHRFAPPFGAGRIKGLKLNGSPVSADELARFRQSVQNCQIEP